MERSTDRILTTHAGSLPRPETLIASNKARLTGESVDEAAFRIRLEDAVHDVVGRQVATALDIPNDGEYGHSMGSKVDYAT